MAMPFTPTLVGQPLAVLGYTLLPLVQCQCEQKGLVTLVVQCGQAGLSRTAGTCPSCGRGFVVQRFFMGPDGMLQFTIEMGAPTAKAS